MVHDLLHILIAIGMVFSVIWLFVLTWESSKQTKKMKAWQKDIEVKIMLANEYIAWVDMEIERMKSDKIKVK